MALLGLVIEQTPRETNQSEFSSTVPLSSSRNRRSNQDITYMSMYLALQQMGIVDKSHIKAPNFLVHQEKLVWTLWSMLGGMQRSRINIEDLRILLQLCVKVPPQPKNIIKDLQSFRDHPFACPSDRTFSTINSNADLKVNLGRDEVSGRIII